MEDDGAGCKRASGGRATFLGEGDGGGRVRSEESREDDAGCWKDEAKEEETVVKKDVEAVGEEEAARSG